MVRAATMIGLAFLLLGPGQSAELQAKAPSPMRPLPQARKTQLADGPKRFVDSQRGDDTAAGSEAKPWKTLAHALRQLAPSDTLYLRGGTYYEKVSLSKSGTAESPIIIASYPGELAVIDGSLREFLESPVTCWEPFVGGAEGEYVSTQNYLDADARRVPNQFLPGSWEPLLGIEDQRPLALGNFADSMIPLHGYRGATDLRTKNEFWLGGKNKDRDVGNYCGPGLWFNRDTGRIHIRLAHTQLAGLGDRGYMGETDPRKLPLIVALGFGEEVLRIVGIQHVTLRDLVFRGATGSTMIQLYGSQHITLDHLTVFGGNPALSVNASQQIHVTHSAFRGLAAPWHGRAHMKYRGTPSYQIVLRNDQPLNQDIEFAHCEFTDDHDFAYLRFVKNLQFHHNFVNNFNDDGLECGPKMRDHTMFIYQNRLGPCLIPFTQHEMTKDDSPVDHDPLSGAFIYRNVIDLRGGTYSTPPTEPDPTGAYLHREGHLVGDHGGPTWSVYHVYHNTLLRETPVFRNSYLFGLGSQGLRNVERDVFNNIFVQMEQVPGIGFVAVKQAANVHEGGNLLWGVKEGPALQGDPFKKFRASPLFADSQRFYEPGWTAQDRIADPRFVKLSNDRSQPADLRLRPDSPAINTGLPLSAEWPDPLRDSDSGEPDVGVLPLGVEPWSVGVDGRIPLFGEAAP